MKAQMIFQRYEFKYLLNLRQLQAVQKAIEPYMMPDQYSHSSIRNLYLDTPDFRLIRRSLERPVYKEKLRIRSYGRAGEQARVFVELKKSTAQWCISAAFCWNRMRQGPALTEHGPGRTARLARS